MKLSSLFEYRRIIFTVVILGVAFMAARLIFVKVNGPNIGAVDPNKWNEFVIDTLNESLAHEQEQAKRYKQQVGQMTRELDSLKIMMELNKEQLNNLAKRKKNEKDANVTYRNWDNNQLAKFLSERYQHNDTKPE